MPEDPEPIDEVTASIPSRSLGRSAGVTAAVALCVGLAMSGLVYSFLAIPVYLAARIDPGGLDRPFLRDGFMRLALPSGLVVGLACGAIVGVWYRRGGRFPEHRPFEEWDGGAGR